ncbi:hypothetical protein TRIUR3_11407 [Triticum urartu]|uniref:Uncharacterized protein n=1 Tax=Triticum urartu TaxID=4572 RepID=M7YEU2_TRIUA|nr:hypothetical protein TRIUR3_11407 [Triticum urartu]
MSSQRVHRWRSKPRNAANRSASWKSPYGTEGFAGNSAGGGPGSSAAGGRCTRSAAPAMGSSMGHPGDGAGQAATLAQFLR